MCRYIRSLKLELIVCKIKSHVNFFYVLCFDFHILLRIIITSERSSFSCYVCVLADMRFAIQKITIHQASKLRDNAFRNGSHNYLDWWYPGRRPTYPLTTGLSTDRHLSLLLTQVDASSIVSLFIAQYYATCHIDCVPYYECLAIKIKYLIKNIKLQYFCNDFNCRNH